MRLVGAYHPVSRPLEQRRLVVEVGRPTALGSVLAGHLEARAVIDAEMVAHRVPARAHLAFTRRGIVCRLEFAWPGGEPALLDLRQTVAPPLLRTLTELSGFMHLPGEDRPVVVRLRLGFRVR